jgi:hypothetical protein
MRRVAVIALASTLSLLSLPVLAHHSAAPFDSTKTVTLSGVIKDFEYTNPHSWLVIDVMESGGKLSTWSFESQGPAFLVRAGILKSDLTPGTSVTVTGHPMWAAGAPDVRQIRADAAARCGWAGQRPGECSFMGSSVCRQSIGTSRSWSASESDRRSHFGNLGPQQEVRGREVFDCDDRGFYGVTHS